MTSLTGGNSACRWAIVLCSLIGLSILTSGNAAAYDGSGFHPSYNTTSNRDFVRRWEANPPRGYPTLAKANIKATKTAIRRYQMIVRGGGWPRMPAQELEVGVYAPSVKLLRRRLMLSGDLRSGTLTNDYFDYALEKAVRRFQASNGLTPTGNIDKRTRAALNVPAKSRLRQLRRGLSRLRGLVSKASGKKRYILVNIPAAQVEAVAKDKVVSRHSGVVGKPDRQTPILTSRIHELNFNPIWRLPPTVITEDLIPKGRKMQRAGKNVLLKYGIDAYSGNRKLDPKKINWKSSQPYNLSYRQKSGKDNPMGFLKINFHNGHSVYMHDTPSDTIFGRNFRAASSGCIRVQNIEKLAAWILEPQGASLVSVKHMKTTGETKNIRVKKPVPLYFAYITAWATPDGIIQFRRDLYRKDGVAATASAY